MKVYAPLAIQTMAALGANALVVIKAEDLTEETANTAQTLEVLNLPANTRRKLVESRLITPFKDSSDPAFNNVTAKAGDGSDDARTLTATQVNANGSYVERKAGTLSIPAVNAAEDTEDVTFSSMADKSLSDLDVGELHLYYQIVSD